MKIPEKFTIAGGKEIRTEIFESGDIYGKFNSASNTIILYKDVKEEDKFYPQSEEDMCRTYFHELFHAFQWYYKCDFSEEEAQVYSNFLYEWFISQYPKMTMDI